MKQGGETGTQMRVVDASNPEQEQLSSIEQLSGVHSQIASPIASNTKLPEANLSAKLPTTSLTVDDEIEEQDNDESPNTRLNK